MLPHAHHRHSNLKALLHIIVRWGFVVFGLMGVCLWAQPWTPQVIWQRQGQGDSSRYGYSILPLGDQNGDGYADFGVYQAGGGSSPPEIELFHGGNPPSQTPYLTVVGDSLWHVDPFPRVLGDINSDGYVDWYLNADSTTNPESYGCAFIYFGGPDMTATPNIVWPFTAYWQGFVPMGDFNGDGYDDLLFADDWNEQAAIYLGANSIDPIPDFQLPWGGSAGVCNLNGDAYDDLEYIIAQTDEITILLGSSSPDTVPEYRWGIAGIPYPVGDLNGDGFDDLASSTGNGTILVRFGGAVLDTTVDAVLNFVPMNVPDRLLRAGDLNHDGYQDLLCIDYSPGPNGSWVTIHLGGLSPNPQPAFTLDWRDPPYNWMPFEETAVLGDVNGDSVDDFMVTAVEGSGYHRGVAVIYGGRSAGANNPHSLIPQQMRLSVYPNPFNASATISYTVPRAGEVKVELFDLTGRLVKTLCEGQKEAGEHAVVVDGEGLASGVYYVRAKVGAVSKAVKVMLLK